MAEDGAATATTTDATSTTDTDAAAAAAAAENGGSNDTELGPEGQKALDAFKARARTSEKESKELRERLEKIEEANKSETDKALDKARKEARTEAETEFQKERRADRLQVAVAKHARDLADVDDVVLNLERGDVDALFDTDNKIDADALTSALDALLKNKPHLKASGVGRPQGSADGGEGEGGSGTTFNDLLRSRQ